MQYKSDKALAALDDGFDENGVYDADTDELAAERQAADEEIVKLKAYKATIQAILDERDLARRLARAGLSPAELKAAHQAVVGIGGIETAEDMGG